MNNPNLVNSTVTDYQEGDGKILFKAVSSGDWSSHVDFFDWQKLQFETDGCEFWTGAESFDFQMDNYIESGQIEQPLLDWITQNGYMDTGLDGKLHFHSSPRFLHVMAGTKFAGASMPKVWDTMRQFGILPENDLPFDTTISVSQYFQPVPQNLLDKAQKFLELIGGKNAIGYKWVLNNQAKNIPLLANKLLQAPLCLGVAVGQPWNQVTPADPLVGSQPQHAVLCYKVDGQNLLILDHYDPFKKVLDVGYEVKYALQGIVNPNYTPPPPLPPIQPPTANITPAQASGILTTIANWLKGKFLPWLNQNPQL